MRAEEKLRDALEQIESYADVQAEQRLIGRGAWEWVAFRAQQALAESGSKTEIERLLEKITNPVYEVIDEHGEIWWTMPKKVLFGIFAGFGYTLKEQEDKT